MSDKLSNEKKIEQLLNEFAAVVRDDSNAADFIYHALKSAGLECGCGNTDLEHKSGSRVYRCHPCRKSFHFTSGTLFSGVARLGAWLGCIILLSNGVAVSAHRMSKLFDIAQATALNMHKKLLMVMSEQMVEGSASLLTTSFNAVIIRRSTETASGKHPVTDGIVESECLFEVDTAQDICDVTFYEEPAEDLGELEQRLVNELKSGAADLDQLCRSIVTPTAKIMSALTMLEINGLIEALPFGRFKLRVRQTAGLGDSQTTLTKQMLKEIKLSVAHISEYFQGISKKCLQIYMASYWNFTGRLNLTLEKMLDLCLAHEPIGYREILALKSTRLVNV
jgi:transposase-like protein